MGVRSGVVRCDQAPTERYGDARTTSRHTAAAGDRMAPTGWGNGAVRGEAAPAMCVARAPGAPIDQNNQRQTAGETTKPRTTSNAQRSNAQRRLCAVDGSAPHISPAMLVSYLNPGEPCFSWSFTECYSPSF